jgi:hypothetical protein
LLDLLDADLERGEVLLELCKITFDDLMPTSFIGEPCFDPPERLGDRVVFSLEPLDAPVDLVEVTEHLPKSLVRFFSGGEWL